MPMAPFRPNDDVLVYFKGDCKRFLNFMSTCRGSFDVGLPADSGAYGKHKLHSEDGDGVRSETRQERGDMSFVHPPKYTRTDVYEL